MIQESNFSYLSTTNNIWLSARLSFESTWEHSSKKRAVVLALHGILATKYIWDGVVRGMFIDAGYIFLDVDLRGHGQSEGVLPTTSALVGDVIAGLDAVVRMQSAMFDDTNVTLLGWSYGGGVVDQTLQAYPERFVRGILLAPIIEVRHLQTPGNYPVQLSALLQLGEWATGTHLDEVIHATIVASTLTHHLVQALDANMNAITIPVYMLLQPFDDIVIGNDIYDTFKKNTHQGSVLHVLHGVAHSTSEFTSKSLYTRIITWMNAYTDVCPMYLEYKTTDDFACMQPVHETRKVAVPTIFHLYDSMFPFSTDIALSRGWMRRLLGRDVVLPQWTWCYRGMADTYAEIYTNSSTETYHLESAPVVRFSARSESRLAQIHLYVVVHLPTVDRLFVMSRASYCIPTVADMTMNIDWTECEVTMEYPSYHIPPGSVLYIVFSRVSWWQLPLVPQEQPVSGKITVKKCEVTLYHIKKKC